VLGLLLTAAAASLGAPFWFDLLNKFINVRGAGKSPEEKPRAPDTKPQAEARDQPARGGSAAGAGANTSVVQSISPGQPIASPGPPTEEEGFTDAVNAG
jgi:hypothetical protein